MGSGSWTQVFSNNCMCASLQTASPPQRHYPPKLLHESMKQYEEESKTGDRTKLKTYMFYIYKWGGAFDTLPKSKSKAQRSTWLTYLNKENKVLKGGVEVGLLLQLHHGVKVLVVNMGINPEETLQNSLCHRHKVFGKWDTCNGIHTDQSFIKSERGKSWCHPDRLQQQAYTLTETGNPKLSTHTPHWLLQQ